MDISHIHFHDKWTVWLRLVGLTVLVWFGPSVLVLQQTRSWAELATLAPMLPVFPGLMVCNVVGSLCGRLPDAGSLILATLVMIMLVLGTVLLAFRSYSRSSEWLPLVGAFFVSSVLWWMASAMLAA